MRTPEFFEKQKIKKFLDNIRAWHFSPFMAGMGKAGIPDIIACYPLTITSDMVGMRIGVFIGVEVKRDGKEPTVLQGNRITDIQQAGGFAVWGTADRVIPQLRKLPYAPDAIEKTDAAG